jgi:hypothetical protein
MTLLDGVATLQRCGYRRRHAAFLTHVLACGGYFLRRQLVAATQQPDGGVATKFLRRLVARGYAQRGVYGRRTRLYHLRDGYFYETIGDPDSPCQRRVGVRAIVRRLITLDTVLAFPEARALVTAEEKRDHFGAQRGLSEGLFPMRWERCGRHGPRCVRRVFPDRAPILVEPPDDRVSIVYVQGPANSLAGWTTFLETYAPLLSHLPRARVVFATVDPEGFRASVEAAFARWQTDPQAKVRARARARAAALRPYFQLRRQVEGMVSWDVPPALRAAPNLARRPLADATYDYAYERWKLDGEALIARVEPSPEQLEVAHVELVVQRIPYRYDCFGTLVAQSLRARKPRGRPRPRRIDSARSPAPRVAGTTSVRS